ncbi:hypothetical protein FLJC2902T_18910 [Flavobacterium limnosediminis JC2902]|uniref:Uncharacterized protein n=1 Tax=Flavobacterium limnosediminis JC2902 TaxID=1341181 RepID=V6SPX9_9FLAO|nr:hypothetical protein FLJC2902T_18910 [Flavobacterium limnosediminis JC2902]
MALVLNAPVTATAMVAIGKIIFKKLLFMIIKIKSDDLLFSTGFQSYP